MAIPSDHKIKRELLLLLDSAPEGTVRPREAYRELAPLFPSLTPDEKNKRYQQSQSKWANAVQWARHHLVERGYIFDAKGGKGKGYWTITPDGRQYVQQFKNTTDIRQAIESAVVEKENEYTVSGQFDPSTVQDNRERSIASIVRRRGQPEFRRRLLDIYKGRCAITGDDVEEALEASHIIPYKGEETNHPSNGLLLRADLHTLFDLRLLSIDTTYMTIVLSPKLMKSTYRELNGRKLSLPTNDTDKPSPEALEIHRAESGL
jgi:hypothetical protein